MYYPVNNFGNCFIFNKSLAQDLESYSIEYSGSDIHLIYNNDTIQPNNKINLQIDKIASLIPPLNSDDDINVWKPIIVDSNNSSNNVGYSAIFQKTLNDNPILGIDKIISFPPKFKNWDIEELEGNKSIMTSNWHINSILGSSLTEYGVLCWYKFSNYTPSSGLSYDSLPDNTKFVLESDLSYTINNATETIPAKTLLVKFNNAYIKRLDKNNAIIQSNNSNINTRSNPINFNSEKILLSVSSISNKSLLNQCKLLKDSDLIINNKSIDLFISDGECFSYYYGFADRLRHMAKQLVSRTYISPRIHKIYREVYHRLTLNKQIVDINFKPTMNRKKARLFQKLCYFLASGPLMDRTTIDFLSDPNIHDSISSYLDEPMPDINTERTKLLTILNEIYTKYKNLSSYNYKNSISSNYVSSKKDLFKAIMQKYSCSLWINGHTKLKYKTKLDNGPHACISTQTLNWRPKSVTNNIISYNNYYIKVGNILYKTDFSDTSSVIKISADNLTEDIKIPLADISLVKSKAPPLYMGTGIFKDNTNRNFSDEIVFQTNTDELFGSVGGSQTGSVVSTDLQVFYSFEQISGPKCLRFDHLNKGSRYDRYKKTTTQSIGSNIYVRQSGTYEVKCTRSNYGRVESDIITLTTDPNYFDAPISVDQTVTEYPKLITSNIKSIAFNKRGLIWIIDSDNYIDTNIDVNKDDIDIPGILKLKDVKFDISNTIRDQNPDATLTVLDSNANLELGFNSFVGNCPVSVNTITIENMRDSDYKYCQCKSFYQEKIKRERQRFSSEDIPTFGASDFFRESSKEYTLIYHDINGRVTAPEGGFKKITLKAPTSISTKYSSPIISYGGYTEDIVDTIGVLLPHHPNPRNSGSLVPVTGIDNHKLPIIADRSSVLDNNNSNPIFCYLKEIQPSGSGNYVTFSKGHFHPVSGWVVNDNLNGQSNVVINKSELKNSYIFDGIGFSSLKCLLNETIDPYKSSIKLQKEDILIKESFYDRRYGYTNPWGNNNFYTDKIQDDWIDNLSCGDTSINYYLNNDVCEKTIDSIEVQLKFLNHFNPKNLLVSLTIENSGNSNNPNYSVLDSGRVGNLTNGGLKHYLDSTQQINTSGLTNQKTYLLFGEHLDNYKPHFSIKFSDIADKSIVTHNASYLSGSPGFIQKAVKNNGEINVAVAVSGETTKNITSYNYVIKTNQLNNINNSLNKCMGIKLDGTTFTLEIANIEPLEQDNTILDNLNNNIFLTTDNANYSNMLGDNLCCWSIIIHTSKIKDTVDKDILGYIDYNNSISGMTPTGLILSSHTNQHYNHDYIGKYTPKNTKGYDFIGNFTDKNFLIPLVNINAPYPYLSNVSQCIYDDPDIPRNISSRPPEYPSLAGYQLAVLGAMGMSSLGTMGALAGLSSLTAVLSTGGRVDPIIGYLLALKDYNLSMINNSQIFKPIYNEKTYGHADRAIVAISKDGALWYNVEVPIFKYSNTQVVHKNVYKYIKLNSNSPKILSQFAFKILKDIKDLDLVNSVGSISTNIASKNGEQILQGLSLKKSDIVLLTNQTTTSDNGYWMVSDQAWQKIPCIDNCNNIDFLLSNNIGKELVETIKSSNTISKNIIIDNVRAYNFFDNDETIEFSQPSGTTAKIIDKSILSTKNGQKTILTLNIIPSVTGHIFKADSNSNVLLLYKDDISPPSGSYNGNEVSLNMWSLDSTDSFKIKKQTPATRISTIAEGSIGWGTDSIFPTPLSSIELNNNNKIPYNNIFNNTFNDYYHLERLTVVDTGNNITIIDPKHSDTSQDKIKASAYSQECFGVSFNDINQKYTEDAELNRLFKKIHTFSDYDRKNSSFLDLKSDKFISLPNKGYIIIDNDFLFYKTIKFSDSDTNILNTRLSGLLSSTENFDSNSVTDIYQVSSIADFTKYYNSLPTDSGVCYQPNRPMGTVCKKTDASKRLKDLYQEKNDIQQALRINQSGVNIPHISGIVTNHLPTGLIINYKNNDDLYWIHIDPDQKCVINDELSVKVLKSIKTKTIPAITTIGGGGIFSENVITLQSSLGRDLESRSASNPDASIKYTFGRDNEIIRIPDNIIQNNKEATMRKYPELQWTTDDEFYYGNTFSDYSNSKKQFISDGKSLEYIIQYTETYIRPTGLYGIFKVSDIIDLNNINSIKLQFRNLTRKIKNIDSENFIRYGYDYNGNLVRDIRPPSSVGQIANNFVCWDCIDMSGIPTTGLPPFLIMSNEMRYRAFFGSIDGIEHKNTYVSDSQEDWEWIPFEYYN